MQTKHDKLTRQYYRHLNFLMGSVKDGDMMLDNIQEHEGMSG